MEVSEWLLKINPDTLKAEIEKASEKFHWAVAWVAVILNPVFSITDYYNIPASWKMLLLFRLSVSLLTLMMIILRRRTQFPSFIVAMVPFVLISLQNAFVYRFIDAENIFGQHLNYMALLIGASMFVLWTWYYSAAIVIVSAMATAFFLSLNDTISVNQFFVNGGLLTIAVAIFMCVLIQARYNLVKNEISARLALKASAEAIRAQAEEIKRINENLEKLVADRTKELEDKNKALEGAAFINAHKLRSPVASILGLINILQSVPSTPETQEVAAHLSGSAEKLDAIVGEISIAIERGSQPAMMKRFQEDELGSGG